MVFPREFFNAMLKTNLEKNPIISFPIGNSKEPCEMEFHPLAPTSKYQKKDLHRCCFGSLASLLTVSGDNVSARDIALQIEESLNFQSNGLL